MLVINEYGTFAVVALISLHLVLWFDRNMIGLEDAVVFIPYKELRGSRESQSFLSNIRNFDLCDNKILLKIISIFLIIFITTFRPLYHPAFVRCLKFYREF